MHISDSTLKLMSTTLLYYQQLVLFDAKLSYKSDEKYNLGYVMVLLFVQKVHHFVDIF